MTQDQAYREAERKIEEALRSGATELDLSYENLTELPESLGQLTQLRELDLSRNQLAALPESLGQLTQLQTLDLYWNRLLSLPDTISQLLQLQSLVLSRNRLLMLPESLSQLTQLRTLDLADNQLTMLPKSVEQLKSLKFLDICLNEIPELPKHYATEVYCFRNPCSEFQTERSNNVPAAPLNADTLHIRWMIRRDMREVIEIEMHSCGVPWIYQDFLSMLRMRNCIGMVAEIDGKVIGFMVYELQKAYITLRRFVIHEGMRRQGIGIAMMSKLISKLSAQRRASIDIELNDGNPGGKAFLQMCGFRALDGDHTSGLGKARFRLDHNPELLGASAAGLDALNAYLRAKAEEQIFLNEAKLILIGEGEVGKTSLLGALRGDEWVEKRPTTHGVEVKIKSLVLDVPSVAGSLREPAATPYGEADGARKDREGSSAGSRSEPATITLNGWDFGGQNIYRHTHQLFFTAPAVYLAVWNPRRGPEQCCVDEWIKMVKQRAYDESRPDERPRILVVATHGGPQERSAHIDEQLLRDEFGELIVGFHHVDSKTGYGLDELKAAIAAATADIPSVGRSVPTSWKNTLDALRKRSEKDPYISYDQYLAICRGKGVSDGLADTYAAILNELGHLIHYRGDAELQDTMILKPDWLSKAISYVLEDDRAKEQNGLVEHNRLTKIWNNPERDETERYPNKLHAVFLKLMERFDLSYQVAMPEAGAPATSLVAQLVPGGRPADWQQDWPSQPATGDAERKRICRIVDAETGRTAEVEGLLYRLIVRLHRYSLGRNNYYDSRHWKTGLILDDGINGRAFLEEIAGDIHVTVRAAYPDGFLGNLCAEIEWLVDYFWKGLDCRRSVPCHRPCKGLHEVKALVETKREGISKVRCSVCEKFHEIDSLLLAATAKLPMEVVLAELKKVRTELANVKRGVADLDSDVRLMIGQANEQFELFMSALTDPAKDGPRLFSFEPVEPGFWDRPKWIAEKFRLTLWCEHSRLPLPVLTGKEKLGVYEIEFTKDWVKRSAPFLKVLSGTLSLALPIAAPAAKLAMDAAAFDAIEDQLEFGKACAESLLDAGNKIGDWLSSDDATELESGRAVLAQGAMLRELHALLKERDKASGFGGLERVQNKRREFLWVHPQYASEY